MYKDICSSNMNIFIIPEQAIEFETHNITRIKANKVTSVD